jgi:hypothetical protein
LKNYFKPKDFEHLKMSDYYPIEIAAELANKKLNTLIESWPVVYIASKDSAIYFREQTGNTHKARLAFIEPIVKEPCKHEPVEIENNLVLTTYPPQYPPKKYKCKHCGVELVAEWKTR